MLRREEATISGTNRRNIWKVKIYYIDSNSKINIIRDLQRGIRDFKRGCQLRTNIVKDEKSDFFTACRIIVARWRKHYSQLFNVHGIDDVRQTEIHTADRLVPEKSAFEFDLAIENLKSHKSPGIDRIPAEMINSGGRTIRYETHKLIISIWNKEELPEE